MPVVEVLEKRRGCGERTYVGFELGENRKKPFALDVLNCYICTYNTTSPHGHKIDIKAEQRGD